jgi:hypothetical protein
MARIPSVKQLESIISKEIQDKYFNKFSKQAAYLGNGVYTIPATNLYANDTRDLFLMFCAVHEGIQFKNN